ncbi:MAG: hypothetical protein U0441_37960 [Polyangiaceae bacterium]
MPAWLLPPQILLLAAPVALSLAALALGAGERRAEARRAREMLGKPRARVDEAAPGERVVLEGRLHVIESACGRFEDGHEAAAATVESAGARAIANELAALARDAPRNLRLTHSMRAGVLVLRSGNDDVLVEGPVEVTVGSDETDPGAPFHTLSAAVRERIAAATSGAALPDSGVIAPVHARPLFRSLRTGAFVRAAGVLSKASDGTRTGYRDGARWVLGGAENAPVQLAFDGTPRHRGGAASLARGVRRFVWGRFATALMTVVAVACGIAFLIGKPPRRTARPDKGGQAATKPLSAPKPRPGVLTGAAEYEALLSAVATRCAEPRPAEIPARWRCVGEAGGFTMYLPPEMICDGADRARCPEGFSGGGVKLRRHFEGSDDLLATIERTGTFVHVDGAPAHARRTPHEITLAFEEEGAGVPMQESAAVNEPRLWFEVTCDTDDACRRAWMSLQSVRLW